MERLSARMIAGLAVSLGLALFLVSSPARAAGTDDGTWHTSLASAHAAAQKSGKLILVDLYADWCAWCKAMDRQVFSKEQFLRFAAERFELLRVDTEDQAEGTDIKQHFGTETLPTTLVLDTDLVAVARYPGYAPLEPFMAELDRLIASHAELLTVYERFHKADEAEILSTLAQEMLDRRDGVRAGLLYNRILSLGGHTEERQADLERRVAASARLAAWAERSRGSASSSGTTTHGDLEE